MTFIDMLFDNLSQEHMYTHTHKHNNFTLLDMYLSAPVLAYIAYLQKHARVLVLSRWS